MRDLSHFYIDGTWVTPTGSRRFEVIDPATEEPCGSVAMAESADVDAAVAAPRYLAHEAHTKLPLHHLNIAIETLRTYPFHSDRGGTRTISRPIGVCGLITPWNWPVAVIFMKLGPALATGRAASQTIASSALPAVAATTEGCFR